MALDQQSGVPVTIQFALYDLAGDPLVVEANTITATLRRTTADGLGTEAAPEDLTVACLGGGEYTATFTPGTADRTYTALLAHDDAQSDYEENVQVWSTTFSGIRDQLLDIGAAVGTTGYLVGIQDGPWTADEAMQVTLTFRVRSTVALFDPSAIRRVDLLDTDGSTVLQFKLPDMQADRASLGTYRVAFNGPEAHATYYVRVWFTPVAGDDEVFAVLPAQVNDGSGNIIAGVMSADDLLTNYLGHIVGGSKLKELLLCEVDGTQLVPNAMIEAMIRSTSVYVERVLETNFTIKRVACRPEIAAASGVPLIKGTDYDIEDDAYPWVPQHTMLQFGHITLRKAPVTRLTRVRALYGSTVLYQFPLRWFQLKHRQGVVEMVTDFGTVDSFEGGAIAVFTLDFYQERHGGAGNTIPAFWAIDYETGLGEVPDDLKAVIGWRAAAKVLSVAAVKANKMAVSSQSVGVDGLSRGQSLADAQPGGRFARLINSPVIQEWTSDDRLLEMKRLLRPSIRLL